MKGFRILLGMALLAVIMGHGTHGLAEVSVETGFQFDYWDSNLGTRGKQAVIPMRLTYYEDAWSISLLSGYVYTSSRSGESISISHPLDTKVSLTYMIMDKLPMDIMLGLDFNLPTGKTNLDREEEGIVLDPDLVKVTSLGEGFNVNPTISVAKQFGNWSLGLGIGVLWRGEYDYSEELQNYDPGQVYNILGRIRYVLTESMTVIVSGEAAFFSKEEVDGDPFFQPGNYYSVAGQFLYKSDPIDCSFTLSAIFRGKSKYRNRYGDLEREDENSFGDEYSAILKTGYSLNPKTRLVGTLKALYIDDNDYPEDSYFHIGTRKKLAAGLGVESAFSERTKAGIVAEFFTLKEEERLEHLGEDMEADGISLKFSLIHTF